MRVLKLMLLFLGQFLLQDQGVDAVRIVAREGTDYAVAVAFIERSL
jgi:hypothetical protein